MSAASAWATICVQGNGLGMSSCSTELCTTTVHFKLPDTWPRAYIALTGRTYSLPLPDAEGWSTFSLDDPEVLGTLNSSTFYFSSTRDYICYEKNCMTTRGVNVSPQQPEQEGFTCKALGNMQKPEVWIMEHPDPRKAGQVYISYKKPDIKDFYVFVPQTMKWFSSQPLINEDGIDHELYMDPMNCGWYYRRYVDEELPKEVLIHRDDDEAPYQQAFGFNGAWEENPKDPEPIPMQVLFEVFQADNSSALYFVLDGRTAEGLPNDFNGLFNERPDVTGHCSYEISATIYDTDAELHPAFSCYEYLREGCQKGAQGVSEAVALKAIDTCIGVVPGIVESTLDSKTKKPKLTNSGKKCFIDDKYFDQLFNYTPRVNEKTTYRMPFSRAEDGKWEFNSDAYVSPGLKVPVVGGFYPAEGKTDAVVLAEDPEQIPLALARTLRYAEGPVFWGPELRKIDPNEGYPVINLFCNGPAWNGGNKCDGLFGDGVETEEAIQSAYHLNDNDCVIGWSCGTTNYAPEGWPVFQSGTERQIQPTSSSYEYRWISKEGTTNSLNGGRNQHFCFESHAKFKFKRGLKFSIIGDDDIWVYFDNKLAIDLGGTHLATPGFADLDKFMPNAEVGSTYDLDIFFCDRRTTMSNMHIKTNILIYQNEDDFEEEYVIPGKEPSSSSSQKGEANSSSSNKNSKSSSSVSKDSKSSSSTSKDSKSSSSTSKDSKSSSSSKKSKSSSSSSDSDNEEYAKPSFRVKMVAPFEFEIVLDEELPAMAKQYAVMDINGQVLSVGELSSADTRIKIPTSGSYIVKVGLGYKQVNVK